LGHFRQVMRHQQVTGQLADPFSSSVNNSTRVTSRT